MEIEVAVAKIGKWATSQSGDTLEMVERPQGGFSFVLVDGQRSGQAAKAISNLVARKAISELAEGVRDGAAARAAHDYLYTYKGGKVSATLNILSVDLITDTLVLSRNSRCPMVVVTRGEGLKLLDEPVDPIGVRRGTKPSITELPLDEGTLAVVYTDGLERAGSWSSPGLDVPKAVQELVNKGQESAHAVADALLEQALELEDGRPRDDISVLVLHIAERQVKHDVRHLLLRVPL
ncbi:MAG: PP2C family protein-serine/threonine phosphatase [Anaerolineae bacterium]|jgi:serine phosphatase RsbU (regulator of sigma subunit)